MAEYRRNKLKNATIEELTEDIKNDLLLGFNLFKNDKGQS